VEAFQAESKIRFFDFWSNPIKVEDYLEKFKIAKNYLQLVQIHLFFEKPLKKAIDTFEGTWNDVDVDWSPYPFCTTSNVITGAVNGSGIPIQNRWVWAVVRPILRVGGDFFPQNFNSSANDIRERAASMVTTGRLDGLAGWILASFV
jgi:adenylosuccinate synthase